MSSRKDVVEAYIEGFRRSDRARILSCLTDDVVWVLHGYKTLQGKEAFDAGYACVAVIQRRRGG
jgi:ketosteroid isomerase-like protein